jgi:class 3 adenylate cyclase
MWESAVGVTVAFLIIALFAMGMAIAFLSADPNAPTSRALSLFLGFLAVTFLFNVPALASSENATTFWSRVFSLLEIGILVSGYEWILRVGRTARVAPKETLIRVAQGLACAYGLLGALLPARRSESWNISWTVDAVSQPGYWVFAVPFFGAAVIVGVFVLRLFRSDFDRAERIRLQWFGVAALFWVAGLPLTRVPAAQALAFAFGEAVFLVGAIRYHVLQGQRGEFIGRFVSPELLRVVRERGLASMMSRSRTEISVVACDLRGFTSFAETAAPEDVMRLLDEYYAAVGLAVAELGGSIKDFAGDGILALVGAPIPRVDHAARALRLGLAIRDRMEEILQRWRTLGIEVGVGVGIATGFATVGAIGSSNRLEYAAVGPPVNLAARLCSRAEAGQILAEARVIGLAGDETGHYYLQPLGAMDLKGFARPVQVSAVVAAEGATDGCG